MHTKILAALLCCAPSAFAADEPRKAVQFIDKTYVDIPRSAGRFRHATSSYDPAQLATGVSAAYEYEGEPEGMAISFYVYPQGRALEAEAVARQAEAVESAIRGHADYTNITVGAPVPFTVGAPPPAMDTEKEGKEKAPSDDATAVGAAPALADGPDNEPAVADESTAAIVKALAESEPPKQSLGSRQSFSFLNRSMPVRSVGLVFHRNLFNIKVRVTAPFSALSEAEFDAVVDEAVGAVVPRILVQNFGECGNIVMPLPDPKEKRDDDTTGPVTLIREMNRVRRENCASNEGESVGSAPAEVVRHTLVYPPGTWE